MRGQEVDLMIRCWWLKRKRDLAIGELEILELKRVREVNEEEKEKEKGILLLPFHFLHFLLIP